MGDNKALDYSEFNPHWKGSDTDTTLYNREMIPTPLFLEQEKRYTTNPGQLKLRLAQFNILARGMSNDGSGFGTLVTGDCPGPIDWLESHSLPAFKCSVNPSFTMDQCQKKRAPSS